MCTPCTLPLDPPLLFTLVQSSIVLSNTPIYFNIYLLLSYAGLLTSNNKSNKVSEINAWLLLVSCQVNMNVCGEFLSLEVPGLSEGRPSLLLGDRVVASLSGLLQVIATTFKVQNVQFSCS